MITGERQKSGKMIRLTQPQILNHPVVANAPGVLRDRQSAGDAFSALCDDGSKPQAGPASARPNSVGGSVRSTSAPDAAIPRGPAAQHRIHRHALHLAIAVDPGLPPPAQLPDALKQDQPDARQIAVTAPDAPALAAPDTPVPGAIPIQPLDPAPPAPLRVMDATANGVSEVAQSLIPATDNGLSGLAEPFLGNTHAPPAAPPDDPIAAAAALRPGTEQPIYPANHSTPPDGLAPPGASAWSRTLAPLQTGQTPPHTGPGATDAAIPAANAAQGDDLQPASPGRPAWIALPKSGGQISKPRQADAPSSSPQAFTETHVTTSQHLDPPEQPANAAGAVAFHSASAPRFHSLYPAATLPPEIPPRDPVAASPDPSDLPRSGGAEMLLTLPVPAALRSHLAWRAAGTAAALVAPDPQPAAPPDSDRRGLAEQRRIGPWRDDATEAPGSVADPDPAAPGLPPVPATPTVLSQHGLPLPDVPAPLPPPMTANIAQAAAHAALPKGLSGAISRAASRPADGDRVDLTLDPVELGRVRFAVISNGDQVQVSLTSERPETLDLLRRHAGELRAELREQGFANPTLSFGQWGQDRAADPPQPAAEFAEITAPAVTEPIAFVRIPAAGLDLRL